MKTANITLTVPQWRTVLETLDFAMGSDRDQLRTARRHGRDENLTLELQAAIAAQQQIADTIQDVIGR